MRILADAADKRARQLAFNWGPPTGAVLPTVRGMIASLGARGLLLKHRNLLVSSICWLLRSIFIFLMRREESRSWNLQTGLWSFPTAVE